MKTAILKSGRKVKLSDEQIDFMMANLTKPEVLRKWQQIKDWADEHEHSLEYSYQRQEVTNPNYKYGTPPRLKFQICTGCEYRQAVGFE